MLGDIFKSFNSNKFLEIIVSISTFFPPGFIHIYVWNEPLFHSTDTIKLAFLALGISAMISFLSFHLFYLTLHTPKEKYVSSDVTESFILSQIIINPIVSYTPVVIALFVPFHYKWYVLLLTLGGILLTYKRIIAMRNNKNI